MTIQQIYNSYYKHIPLEVFNTAVAADATSYNQGVVVKVGNFVKWILKLYQNNSWKTGDSYETKDLLSKFIKYKSKLPLEKRDINRYNSISDLYSLIQTLEGQGVKSQKDVKREGAEVVYEDSEWKIVIPHTEEASCIYGANTKWCTAGRERNMFEYYNKKGPLYININKVTGDKYQFHFETNSFMDAEDKEISHRKIGLSEGVIEYYKSIGKEPYILYDYVSYFYDGFASVKIVGKGFNFINEQGELLWKEDKWFDMVDNFSEGFARVEIEGRGWNFINPQGELLYKGYKWVDFVNNFHEGFAEVKLEGKGWNFINKQGEYLWKEDKWFDSSWRFYEGFAEVYKKDKGWNFINPQGEFLWKGDKWFKSIWHFSEGFAKVTLGNKECNFINKQGELLWKGEWFEYVDDFSNGVAQVYKNGWNIINTNGELLYKGNIWLTHIHNFSEGFAEVKLGGLGWNFINTNGELLWKGEWFDSVDYFSEGFARVYIDGKGWNYINPQGELLWKEEIWFNATGRFYKGFAEVTYLYTKYWLNTKGELIKR